MKLPFFEDCILIYPCKVGWSWVFNPSSSLEMDRQGECLIHVSMFDNPAYRRYVYDFRENNLFAMWACV